MSHVNKVKLDLGYFLDSLLLDPSLNKLEFFNKISKTVNHKFDNLYELTQFVRNCVDELSLRISYFSNNFGVKNSLPFPEPDLFGKHCIRFVSLLNYAVKETFPNAFTSIKHDDQSELALIFFQGKLSIAYKDKKSGRLAKTKNPVCVDFINGEVGYRVNGNVKSEACVKATLHKNNLNSEFNILDATAGFGQDAILFANAGANVLMIERNPIIGLLLADGLERLKETKILNSTIGLRFPISITHQKFNRSLQHYYFNTVYFDPMYPTEKSSAKANKNMQLIQEIVGKDEDQDLLLEAVKTINCNRVVVKRPKNAPFLNNQTTKDSLETKSHRFDYYIFSGISSKKYVKFNEWAIDIDLVGKFKLENDEKLKAITNPTYEDLLKVRQNLHHNNLKLEGLYGNNAKFHAGTICFSECLQRETICAREISTEIYEFSKKIYSTVGFGKNLPGDHDYLRDSYKFKHVKLAADADSSEVKIVLPAKATVITTSKSEPKVAKSTTSKTTANKTKTSKTSTKIASVSKSSKTKAEDKTTTTKANKTTKAKTAKTTDSKATSPVTTEVKETKTTSTKSKTTSSSTTKKPATSEVKVAKASTTKVTKEAKEVKAEVSKKASVKKVVKASTSDETSKASAKPVKKATVKKATSTKKASADKVVNQDTNTKEATVKVAKTKPTTVKTKKVSSKVATAKTEVKKTATKKAPVKKSKAEQTPVEEVKTKPTKVVKVVKSKVKATEDDLLAEQSSTSKKAAKATTKTKLVKEPETANSKSKTSTKTTKAKVSTKVDKTTSADNLETPAKSTKGTKATKATKSTEAKKAKVTKAESEKPKVKVTKTKVVKKATKN